MSAHANHNLSGAASDQPGPSGPSPQTPSARTRRWPGSRRRFGAVSAATSAVVIVLSATHVHAQGPTVPQLPSAQQVDLAQPASPQPASDTGAAAIPSAIARAHHAPVTRAAASEPLVIAVRIDHPELVRQLTLVYRTANNPAFRFAPFRRGSDLPYEAVIAADDVQAPWITYAIELEDTSGKHGAVFASRDSMHTVEIPPDEGDMRERASLQRLDGRRSLVAVSGEYVVFGTTPTSVTDATHATPYLDNVRDQYYRVEGAYTYRPLRTIAEFSLRIGVVRGTSVVPNETDRSKYDVGLNYGAPTVRIRLDDVWHMEAGFLTSVTEVGFSMGASGALLIGDPYGTKLTLGFETIQTFGSRLYSRLDLAASRAVCIAPMIEATDMPHADRFGVRLLTEVRWEMGGGFQLAARGGYQARVSTSGGPAASLALGYGF